MPTTNVPQIVFGPTGLIVPSGAAVLAGVQADKNAAFGGNLNPALNTPQGQDATSQAACINAGNATFATFVNQTDPANASGFMQDALAQLYFLDRDAGAGTIVTCVLLGQDGFTVPTGSQGKDTSGNIYVSTEDGTFVDGTCTVPFQNIVQGPIACPDNTLNAIYIQVDGWDSINNPGPDSAVLGNNVESQIQFEARRAASVALNSHGPVQSIRANVLQVAGVVDAYVIENVEGTTVYTGTTRFPVIAHSIYAGIAGGVAADVADAIWLKKDPGCNYNGNVTVPVEDTEALSAPYPTYGVKFQTLTNTALDWTVNILDTGNLPDDLDELVQDAMIAQFTGQTGAARARAGGYVLAGTYFAPIVAAGAAIGIALAVSDILIGDTFAASGVTTSGSYELTLTVSSGVVSVGTGISGTFIPATTQIASQLSGTSGGSGVYLITNAATGAGTNAMAGAPTSAVLMGIDQEPTISADNISVNIV